MKLVDSLVTLIKEDVARNKIEDAIERHRMVRIYYAGDKTVSRGWRFIEPYVYGVSLADNRIIRVYQLNGVTDTETPGWKTFRVDGIINWVESPRFFFEPISDEKRDPSAPKYNPNGDKLMKTIYKQAQF